jgi:methionine-rich copper-binding protein CopC
MKTLRSLIITCFCLLFTSGAFAQEVQGAGVSFTVTNGKGISQQLALGVLEGASTGIDPQFGESELPPLPPAEIFDARFNSTPGKSQLGSGSLNDYRPIESRTALFTATYTLAYQGGNGVTSVKIAWDGYPGRITKMTFDGADMAGKTEFNTQFGQGQVTIVVTFSYLPLSFKSNPASISFVATSTDPLPVQTFTLTPEGDPTGSWVITPGETWLSASPSSGSGQQTVEVTLNTNVIPTGTYSTALQVRSLQEPASLDIPVTLNFTVPSDIVSAPNGMRLVSNYPNPFSAATPTAIELDLGQNLSTAAAPVLKVYDVNGREVADLSSRLTRKSGSQTVQFNAANLPAGSYSYRLSYNGYKLSKTMVLVK